MTTPQTPVDAPLTQAMIDAGAHAWMTSDTVDPAKVWHAMLEASASALAAMPAPPLKMTGYQLREALEFLAPDGTAEQFEQEVCIQHGPERVCDAGTPDESTDPAGLYCWLSDCPEEGSIALTGEDARTGGGYCKSCNGSGEQMHLSGGGPDAYDVLGPCSQCNGTGDGAQQAGGVPAGFVEWLKTREADTYSCGLLVRDALERLAAAPSPQPK